MQKSSKVYLFSPSKTPKSSSHNHLNLIHPQISQKLSQYDAQTINNDQQPTTRLYDRTFRSPQQISPINIQYYDQSIQSNLQPQLQQFKNQLNTHYEIIVKLSNVIDYLKEENKQLICKVVEAQKKLEEVTVFYQSKLLQVIKEYEQKSIQNATKQNSQDVTKTNSRDATITNSIIINRPAKITPLKIYHKVSQDNFTFGFNQSENTGLQDLYKMMVYECVNNFQREVNKLNNLCEEESSAIQAIMAQHQYIEAYIQDEILNSGPWSDPDKLQSYSSKFSNISENINGVSLQLLNQYKNQIIGWQSYANSLRKQLIDCIHFIQKSMASKQYKKSKKRPYSNEDLIKYIGEQIGKKMRKKVHKKDEQIKQLKQLLDQAYVQLKNCQKIYEAYEGQRQQQQKGDIQKYLS